MRRRTRRPTTSECVSVGLLLSGWIKSAGPKYTAVANPQKILSLADWLSSMTWPKATPTIDMAHAVLVEVDWTKLAGNNAGLEVWVVNPIPGGWKLFEVR